MQKALDLANTVATHLDTACQASRQVGSQFGWSTYCFKYASLAPPRACLAWLLRDFVTKRHE